MELTTEQRTQAVIDFNKMLDSLPNVLPYLSENDKQLLPVVREMTDAERKKVVQNIRNKRQELDMDRVH